MRRRVAAYQYDDLEILSVKRHHEASRAYYDRYFPLILDESRHSRAILDVSCGTGRLLELLAESLVECKLVGVELNEARAQFAERLTGHVVYQKPIHELPLDSAFDTIILIDVLSHVESFDELFIPLRSLLTADGKVVLKVGEHAPHVRQDAIRDWGVPDHVHFLGLKTLRFLANRYGFVIVRHDRVPLWQELFEPSRWRVPGRSRRRDAVKRGVATTPFALAALRQLYALRHGESTYSSFVTLKRSA